jgi:hypothetical protein
LRKRFVSSKARRYVASPAAVAAAVTELVSEFSASDVAPPSGGYLHVEVPEVGSNTSSGKAQLTSVPGA